jgi:hypothetical protein
MADVTGPISTLPGAVSQPASTQMCDTHDDRPAYRRVQGETDSFGSEMHDMCEECYENYRKEMEIHRAEAATGVCDWCKAHATDLRNRRDYDEGMSGPVYRVCGACARRDNEAAQAELDDYYDDDYDDYDDDSDDDACPNCRGDGTDPMDDHLLPCHVCQGQS